MRTNHRPPRSILATDLDGTLIPLADNARNLSDLELLGQLLKEHHVELAYVTGRHLQSVMNARHEHNLPPPDWIICDVGTSIHEVSSSGAEPSSDATQELARYREHLHQLTNECGVSQVLPLLADIREVTRQEPEKQGTHKLSFYCDAKKIDSIVPRIEQRLDESAVAYSVIHSIDPFNGDGLIDVLPRGVSKAYALRWWLTNQRQDSATKITRESAKALESADRGDSDAIHPSVVYAGDSGNDLAVFLSGMQSIVVGNADEQLKERVRIAHVQRQWSDRLYVADQPATSGVLQGAKWFNLF